MKYMTIALHAAVSGILFTILWRMMKNNHARIGLLEKQNNQQDEDIWDLQCMLAPGTNETL